jgi:hypothetical protein
VRDERRKAGRTVDLAVARAEFRGLAGRQQVADLVRAERIWRDQGEWDKLGEACITDAYVRTSWYGGTGPEVARMSRDMAGRGRREGEIALIIRERCKRAALRDAWAHVAAVTAANDFGLYDLRYADPGSNVHAKGGDGYTPLRQPGDLLVGDRDGIVVLPRTIIADVVRAGLERERQQRFIAEMAASGAAIDGSYPIGDRWRPEYVRWLDQVQSPADTETTS